jgi:hypothetical protein
MRANFSWCFFFSELCVWLRNGTAMLRSTAEVHIFPCVDKEVLLKQSRPIDNERCLSFPAVPELPILPLFSLYTDTRLAKYLLGNDGQWSLSCSSVSHLSPWSVQYLSRLLWQIRRSGNDHTLEDCTSTFFSMPSQMMVPGTCVCVYQDSALLFRAASAPSTRFFSCWVNTPFSILQTLRVTSQVSVERMSRSPTQKITAAIESDCVTFEHSNSESWTYPWGPWRPRQISTKRLSLVRLMSLAVSSAGISRRLICSVSLTKYLHMLVTFKSRLIDHAWLHSLP